jgi:hypothetical protein
MNAFRIWSKIEQFTEIPTLIDGVDERLAWVRNWTSWRVVKLDKLILIHMDTGDHEKALRTSILVTEEWISGMTSPVEATVQAYDLIRTKLNILSAISEKGFGINSIYPAHYVEKDLNSYVNETLFSVPENKPNPVQDAKGKPIIPVFSSIVMTGGNEPGEYLREEKEIVLNIQQGTDIKLGNTIMTKISELQNEWMRAYAAFSTKNRQSQNPLNQSMEFYRVTRMSRDLYSRYLLDWTALDSLTPFVQKMGREKTNGMASYIGGISGINDLPETIWKI